MMRFSRPQDGLFVVGAHSSSKTKKTRFSSKFVLSIVAASILCTTFHYRTAYAMPLKDSLYPATLSAELGASRELGSTRQNQKGPLSKISSYFHQESQTLTAFCEAWNSHTSRGARDPFSWVQELTPAEGLIPFSIAIPTLPHGGLGILGRTLERRGTWQPELTENLLVALDQAGPDSVFIDIGAGLGWFSFVAAAANHPALTLENDNLNIAAMRRSSCANAQQNGNFVLLGGGTGGKIQGSALGLTETLLNVAPNIVEALSPPAPPQQRPGQGQEKESVLLSPRGSAALVHPPTPRGALEVMLAGASVLWPEIKPLVIAMVLPADKDNILGGGGRGGNDGANINYNNELEEQETEELASLVFHKMHALGYDVRMDASTNMAQAPAAFSSLAAMVARGNAETVTMWFTWKGKKL